MVAGAPRPGVKVNPDSVGAAGGPKEPCGEPLEAAMKPLDADPTLLAAGWLSQEPRREPFDAATMLSAAGSGRSTSLPASQSLQPEDRRQLLRHMPLPRPCRPPKLAPCLKRHSV